MKTQTEPNYIRGMAMSIGGYTTNLSFWNGCFCIGQVKHLRDGKYEALFLSSGMWGLDDSKPIRKIVDRDGNGISWVHEQWTIAENKRLGKKYIPQAYSHRIEAKEGEDDA